MYFKIANYTKVSRELSKNSFLSSNSIIKQNFELKINNKTEFRQRFLTLRTARRGAIQSKFPDVNIAQNIFDISYQDQILSMTKTYEFFLQGKLTSLI